MDELTIDSNRDTPDADHMAVVVHIDPSLQFSTRSNDAQTTYIANDPRTGNYYRFGVREYHVVTLMDGKRTLAAIHRQIQRDGIPWSEIDMLAFVRELAQHRLVLVVPNAAGTANSVSNVAGSAASDATEVAESTPQNKTRRATTLRLMGGLLTQRIPLISGDRVASKLMPSIGFLFSGPAMICWLVLVVSGIAVVWSNSSAFALEVRRLFDQQLWLVLGLLWCVLKFVHECGHAVCAKRHGVRVGPMGIMFFLFAPLAFVDVTDAWKLVRRRDRVQIALAGVYLELAIGAAAAWLWWFCPVGFTKHLAAQIFLVAGPATLLVNLNPLLRLDGYYVISDLLEIPNLRADGRRRLTAIIEQILFRLPMPEFALAGWRRDFAVVHAFCSVIFQLVWMTGLVIAVSAWAKGLGVVIAIVASVMWGLLPLLRWTHKIWTIPSREGWVFNFYQRRLIAIITILCLVLQYATVTTSPFARRVPVVVQYQNEQIARAPVGAFVTSVFVRCGDRVERGALLMELEQSELALKRDQLMDQRDVEFAKAIQYRQRGEIALSNAAQSNGESLDRQLEELADQIESMRIVAKRDGKITTPATDQLLGSYLSQGDELLRVADPQEKEVVAIVAESNLKAYKLAASAGQVAKIRLRGGVSITAPLTRLQPSASRTLPHPALSVTVGGPLAVQMLEQSDSNELVHPQLRSVLPLDPFTSLSVKSGQIGRLTIPDDRTIISRIWDRISPR